MDKLKEYLNCNLRCRWLDIFEKGEGGLMNIVHSYKHYGLNFNEEGDLVYKEWAPEAKEVSLVSSY